MISYCQFSTIEGVSSVWVKQARKLVILACPLSAFRDWGEVRSFSGSLSCARVEDLNFGSVISTTPKKDKKVILNDEKNREKLQPSKKDNTKTDLSSLFALASLIDLLKPFLLQQKSCKCI